MQNNTAGYHILDMLTSDKPATPELLQILAEFMRSKNPVMLIKDKFFDLTVTEDIFKKDSKYFPDSTCHGNVTAVLKKEEDVIRDLSLANRHIAYKLFSNGFKHHADIVSKRSIMGLESRSNLLSLRER